MHPKNPYLSSLLKSTGPPTVEVRFNHIIHAEPYVYELDGKRILAFFIPEQNRHQKPLYLNGNPWDAYIRRGARDERVTDNDLQRFLHDKFAPPLGQRVAVGLAYRDQH